MLCERCGDKTLDKYCPGCLEIIKKSESIEGAKELASEREGEIGKLSQLQVEAQKIYDKWEKRHFNGYGSFQAMLCLLSLLGIKTNGERQQKVASIKQDGDELQAAFSDLLRVNRERTIATFRKRIRQKIEEIAKAEGMTTGLSAVLKFLDDD